MENKTQILIVFLTIQIFLISGCGNKPSVTDQKSVPEIQINSQEAVQNAMLEQALRESAFNGDGETVRQLLKTEPDVNSVDEEGRTALMFAAFNGHLEIVNDLIEKGAEVDKRDYLDRTALLYASTGKFPKTVELLLIKGADPNIIDNNEHFTSLMHAAAEGHIEVVKILLDHGADPNLKDVDGDDAESFARRNGHDKVADYIRTLK